MRVYLDAFPAAQVARSLRTRPPRHECPRRRRVSRENVACMQSDAAPHISWLRPSWQCGISALYEPDPAPAPEVPMPFGSAQPSHGCVRDTEQLTSRTQDLLPLIDIIDAAAQKNPVVNSHDPAVPRALVRTLARLYHKPPCRASQRTDGPPDGLLSQDSAWAGLRTHGSTKTTSLGRRSHPLRGTTVDVATATSTHHSRLRSNVCAAHYTTGSMALVACRLCFCIIRACCVGIASPRGRIRRVRAICKAAKRLR